MKLDRWERPCPTCGGVMICHRYPDDPDVIITCAVCDAPAPPALARPTLRLLRRR